MKTKKIYLFFSNRYYTAPGFIRRDHRDFEVEKIKLAQLIEAFHKASPGGIGKHPHPFFGNLLPGNGVKAYISI